jgi:hypothetical protein
MKALALLLMLVSTPAMAFPGGGSPQPCENPPPKSAQAPVTVPIEVYVVPSANMSEWCHKEPGAIMLGCTYLPSPKHAAAIILINATETPAERACTLIYEKAHLPPNNWFDPVAEARAVNVPGTH